jgi:cytosine/adenosine deaminase-related metal-dependent hydrolase
MITRSTQRQLSILFLAGLVAGSALADTLLVKNGLFITMKPGQETPFVGYMTVGPDGRITAVAPGAAPAGLAADRVVDAAGKFVAPGFISTHSHLADSPLRGVGNTEVLAGWGRARQQFLQYTTAEDLYWFVLHGCLDYIRSGVTTAYDFTNNGTITVRVDPGQAAPEPIIKIGPFIEEQIRAKADAGLRFIDSIGLPSTGTDDEIVARVGQVIDFANKNYGTNPLFLKIAISGQIGNFPTKDRAFLEARVMKTYDLINHSHFLESSVTVAMQQPKFSWYEEAGALGPNLLFAHFIHTTPDMVARAGKAGSGMSWQPWPNGRLGDGIADIPLYRKLGLKISMGLDNQNSGDTCDPYTNMRCGLAVIRGVYKDAKAMPVYDILYLHTLAGAEVLQIADKVGSLEPGKFADFLLVDPCDPDTGPLHDAVATYVLSCGQRNLKQVYIGGKLAADGTKNLTFDSARASKEVYARVARIQGLIAAKTDPLADSTLGPEPHPFAVPLRKTTR